MKKAMIASAVVSLLAIPAFAEGDADKGKKVFNKCKACHAVGEGAKNKVGPILNEIVGAAAGQNPDFKYSKALKAKAEEGLMWDTETLTAFLKKPKDVVPKTKMSFAGLRKDVEIVNLIAYLDTFTTKSEEEAAATD